MFSVMKMTVETKKSLLWAFKALFGGWQPFLVPVSLTIRVSRYSALIRTALAQPLFLWCLALSVGLSLSPLKISVICASLPSYSSLCVRRCLLVKPTLQVSIPPLTRYAARAFCSLPSIITCSSLILITMSSSNTAPQHSWFSQDLPLLLALMPTTSKVMPLGWHAIFTRVLPCCSKKRCFSRNTTVCAVVGISR